MASIALVYEQFPLQSRDIRVLRLLPSPSADSPLECTLSVVHLPADSTTDPPAYKALSYAWNDTQFHTSSTVASHAIILRACVPSKSREAVQRGEVKATNLASRLKEKLHRGQERLWRGRRKSGGVSLQTSAKDVEVGETRCEVAIPANLSAALHQLRRRAQQSEASVDSDAHDGTVSLWVDYICINQADISERNEQVALMGDIFRRSEEVVIWIGEAAATTETNNGEGYHWKGGDEAVDLGHISTYMDFFYTFIARETDSPWHAATPGRTLAGWRGHEYGVFCLLSLLSQGSPGSGIPFYDSLAVETPRQQAWAHGIREALWDMLERRWWQRTWVVQECVLAQKATVQLGHLSAPWSMFSRAAYSYAHVRATGDPTRQVGEESSIGVSGHSRVGDPLARFATLVMQVDSTREALSQGDSISPLHVLQRFHARQATDPRDKVFGLLGLMNSPFLAPDYGLSCEEVFLAAAAAAITSSQNLEILASASSVSHVGGTESKGGSLPSWCPDWSARPRESEWQRLQWLRLYHTCEGTPPPSATIYRLPATTVLELRGVWVGEVLFATDTTAPDYGAHRFRANKTAWADSLEPFLPFGESCPEPRRHMFWRALCGDVVLDSDSALSDGRTGGDRYRRVTETDAVFYAAWEKDGEAQGGFNRRQMTVKGFRRFYHVREGSANLTRNRFFYAAQMMTGGRRMFYTADGRVGVGPAGTNKGDLIAVLAGSATPFLLRPSGRVEGHGKRSVLLPLNNAEEAKQGPESDPTVDFSGDCYRVVGDAYVSGIMDGEAASGKLETICLV
ncbi:heterokaryon incompatibility protein-domain-containing protein [Cercophora newfieldiana]|uniref:Heterokaryon incompatibility protein-domain-containing protein n=1 Tax=Cercophora newfieldiana TaxID=92897 RepID=A0AA39Y8J0_9PEZI|nr:heterokaryon incompatibility protein-domain-containing protein [Cercophora newfieldiana]